MTTLVNSRWRASFALFVGLFFTGLWAYSQASQTIRAVEVFSGRTMGTSYQVKIVSDTVALSSNERQRLEDLIEKIFEAVNAQMSTYIPSSEISRFNAWRGTGWYPVSKEFAFVSKVAKSIWTLSEGAFDPTVLPLVEAWGFGAKDGATAQPTDLDLKILRSKIGMEKIEVRLEPPSLSKINPEASLDLSAIAKGYGVDRVAEKLDEFGHANYMVEIGGEIRVSGNNAAGKLWTLGIEKPENQRHRVQKKVSLGNGALATSGDYRNYREVDGKRLSHIIDPTTGAPVNHRLVSVSVIAETCAMADGWATALLVLGPERALLIADRLNLAAYFLVMTDEGIKEVASNRFDERFATKEVL